MSGAAQGNNNMAKATGGTDPNVANSGKPTGGDGSTKPRVMEEDDEFEDFPTEGMNYTPPKEKLGMRKMVVLIVVLMGVVIEGDFGFWGCVLTLMVICRLAPIRNRERKERSGAHVGGDVG